MRRLMSGLAVACLLVTTTTQVRAEPGEEPALAAKQPLTDATLAHIDQSGLPPLVDAEPAPKPAEGADTGPAGAGPGVEAQHTSPGKSRGRRTQKHRGSTAARTTVQKQQKTASKPHVVVHQSAPKPAAKTRAAAHPVKSHKTRIAHRAKPVRQGHR